MVSFYHRNSNIKIASCFITDFPGCILFSFTLSGSQGYTCFFAQKFLFTPTFIPTYLLQISSGCTTSFIRFTSVFIQFTSAFKWFYGILRFYNGFHLVLLHLSYGPVLIQLSHGLLGTHTVILRFHTAFILWLFHDFTKAFTRFYHGFQPVLLRLSNGFTTASCGFTTAFM